MGAAPYLSDDEILKIVWPLTQPAAILRWFRNNGFPEVRRRPSGLPLVSRAYFDTVTAGNSRAVADAMPKAEPNVDALLQKIANRAKTSPVSNKV